MTGVATERIGLETTFCPCDKCIYTKTCKKECKSFDIYAQSYSSDRREINLKNFIEMQNLSTAHLRVIKNGQRTSHCLV